MRGRMTASVLVAAVFALLPGAAYACPVCFGGAEGPMAEGVNNGIMLLLGVIGAVQLGFVALFVGIWRRGRRSQDCKKAFKVIDGGAG